MNEVDLLSWLQDLVKVAPVIGVLIWIVIRADKREDKRDEREEARIKVITTSLDKSTEVQGRNLEAMGRQEATALRLSDIVQDYTVELRSRNHS